LFPNEGLKLYYDVPGILASWIEKYSLPPKSIILVSGNYTYQNRLGEDSTISYIPYSMWENSMSGFYNKDTIKKLENYIIHRHSRKKIFLNYNRRARYSRCKLVYELVKTKLIDYGFVSLGKHTDFKSRNILPEEFVNSLPLTFDDTDLEINHAHDLVLKDYFNSYVSLVSETSVDVGDVFPTEKIFKPILTLHPFIVVATPGFLSLMRSFGYRTFSEWFDESYDTEPDIDKKIDMIIREIDKITKKSEKQLKNMLVEMLPTLRHNLNVYLKRTSSKEFQEQLENELCK